jgi:uncharacterized protein (TIGR02145 family)
MKRLLLILVLGGFIYNVTAQQIGTFTDPRDGKTYKTTKIGKQTWMAENLAYKVDTGCWAYSFNVTNVIKYGYLYAWETAKTVCPKGWHLPSDAEWKTLTKYLGGDSIAGEKLKSQTGWDNSENGTNTVGFSALPGGYFSDEGYFNYIGGCGNWWSSTEYETIGAWYCYIGCLESGVNRTTGLKESCYSVRCLKN